MHVVELRPEVYEPPAQATHTLASAPEYSPAVHPVQLTAPEGENVPASHDVQDWLDPYFPAGHAAQLGKGLPTAVVIVPGGQGLHADTLDCPPTSRYVLSGQPVQLLEPTGA